MVDTDVLGQAGVTFDEFGQSVTATWSQMTATSSELTCLSSLTFQPSFNARGYPREARDFDNTSHMVQMTFYGAER